METWSAWLLAEEGQPPGLMNLLPFLAIGVLFYLMFIRPESRRRNEMDQRNSELKKDDQIVTIGGIWGIVVAAQKDSEFITIRVDETSGARLRILRSSVSKVLGGDTEKQEST